MLAQQAHPVLHPQSKELSKQQLELWTELEGVV